MRWNVVIAAVVVLVCAQPGPASALSPADAQRAIDVAAAQWPGSPCRGQERVVWETPESAAVNGPLGAVGWAVWGTCEVHVSASIRPLAALCTTLQHEFGHLAGLAHSTDPRDIMAPSTSRRPPSPPCLAAFPVPPPKMVWRCRPLPGGEWCGFVRDRLAWRCWRTTGGETCATLSYSEWRKRVRRGRARGR